MPIVFGGFFVARPISRKQSRDELFRHEPPLDPFRREFHQGYPLTPRNVDAPFFKRVRDLRRLVEKYESIHGKSPKVWYTFEKGGIYITWREWIALMRFTIEWIEWGVMAD